MDSQKRQELATILHQARLNANEIGKLTDQLAFNIDQAYEIQEEGIRLREQSGESVIGSKMGLTSEAKRKQMNLDSPVYGILTDKMQLQDGDTLSLKGSIHPKIEPEIAFYFDRDLDQSSSKEDILKACTSVSAAMEILDSRYKGFKYFSLEDVIADNSSSFKYVLGPRLSFKGQDLKDLKMTMKVNDTIAQEGTSTAISGDPVTSIVQQVELFAKRGHKVKAGSFVLAGAATPAVALEPGMRVTLEVESMSSVSLNITA